MPQASEHSAELRVTTGIVGRLTHESLCHGSGLLESRTRLFFIAQMQIQGSFQKCFWARASLWVSQCLAAKLLYHLKSLSKLPLQR